MVGRVGLEPTMLPVCLIYSQVPSPLGYLPIFGAPCARGWHQVHDVLRREPVNGRVYNEHYSYRTIAHWLMRRSIVASPRVFDFRSLSSQTRFQAFDLETAVGVEPTIRRLQRRALPFGYAVICRSWDVDCGREVKDKPGFAQGQLEGPAAFYISKPIVQRRHEIAEHSVFGVLTIRKESTHTVTTTEVGYGINRRLDAGVLPFFGSGIDTPRTIFCFDLSQIGLIQSNKIHLLLGRGTRNITETR